MTGPLPTPPPVEVGTYSFIGGLVTVKPPHLLDEGQASDVQNMDPFVNYGSITRRLGHVYYQRPNGTVDAHPVTGLYQYHSADGTVNKVFASNFKDIYEIIQPSTWTSRFTNGSDLQAVNFTTFGDLMIAVSPTMTTSKSSGAAFATLLGTPPSNGKYIENHRNRVFIANSSAGASRLSFSVLGNPEDWTTIAGVDTDAGFIDVGKDDGDVITGIASLGTVMIIWKNNSTWMLAGSGPLNFQVRPISTVVGCAAPRSIVKADMFALFLSNLGVYSVTSNGNSVVLVSYNVKPSLDALSATQKGLACAGRLLTQYWLCVDANNDGVNDTTYVLDYVYGSWTKYTAKDENVFFTLKDGTLLSGVTSLGSIRQHNTGQFDELKVGGAYNQNPIQSYWESKDYDFGSWVPRKTLLDCVLMGRTPSDSVSVDTQFIQYYLNGTLNSSFLSPDLTVSGSGDMAVWKKQRHFVDSAYKNFLRLRLTNIPPGGPASNTPLSGKITGFSLLGDVYSRETG